jgi:hypothetical protein
MPDVSFHLLDLLAMATNLGEAGYKIGQTDELEAGQTGALRAGRATSGAKDSDQGCMSGTTSTGLTTRPFMTRSLGEAVRRN